MTAAIRANAGRRRIEARETIQRMFGLNSCPIHLCHRSAYADAPTTGRLVPHELIYSEKPDAIGILAALIVDEAAWADGLEGTDLSL